MAQPETCWIRNLEGCEPILEKHCLYMQCIRRANLDAMNARAKVVAHVNFITDCIKNAKAINRTPYFKEQGPFPLSDTVGMGLAVDMLLESQPARGRIGKHIQFETMRKCRGTFTLAWRSSPLGVAEGGSFSTGKGWVGPDYDLSYSIRIVQALSVRC